jgi:hypothetical protein
MKERFAKLIDVKTITTFAIVGAVIYLGVIGKLDATKLFELGMIIVTFFFVKESNKKPEV